MSRSKLSNTEIKFYTAGSGGGADTIHAKLKGSTQDSVIFEGSSSAVAVKLKNIADPTLPSEASTKNYVDTKVQELQNGLSWKLPVKCKSNANASATLNGNVLTCTANAQQTFDGQLVALDDRVLIAEQTDQTQNGIYVCTTQGNARAGQEEQAVFARATDCDTATELESCAVFVELGTNFKDTGYVQTADALVLGTSNIVFAQFSTVGELTVSNTSALQKTGNSLSVLTDNITLEIESNTLVVKDLGIVGDKVATGTLTGNHIQDASLTDIELADNSCVERTINSSAVIERCLANGACTQNKISSNPPAISSDHLQVGAVDSSALGQNQVQTIHCQDGFCTSDKIGGQQLLSSHFSAGCVDSNSVGNAQIQTIHCADGFCTNQKLASQCVTSAKVFPLNILTSHLSTNPPAVTSATIGSNQIQSSHMKVNSINTDSIVDGACTSDKIANNAITSSKLGTLNGLTVAGVVNATSFVATSGSGEQTDSFGLPKCKTLSIDFDTDQSISGNDTYVSIGDESDNACILFSNDDDITMGLVSGVFRVKHNGMNGTIMHALFSVSFYNGSGVAQPFQDITDEEQDFNLLSAQESSYLFSLTASIGDGATRIAKIRMRAKHDVASDSLAITDSSQVVCIAIDDSSGNTQRTFSSGTLS